LDKWGAYDTSGGPPAYTSIKWYKSARGDHWYGACDGSTDPGFKVSYNTIIKLSAGTKPGETLNEWAAYGSTYKRMNMAYLRAPQYSLGEYNIGSLDECAKGFAMNTKGYTGFAWCRDDATCEATYRCIYYGKVSATYLTSSVYKKGDTNLAVNKNILVSTNEDGARQCNQAKKDHTVDTADDMCAKGADGGGVMQYYSVMDGIKASGHNLGAETTKTDRDSCAAHCATTATCVAFTWKATGTKCQAKSKRLSNRYDPAWTNYDT